MGDSSRLCTSLQTLSAGLLQPKGSFRTGLAKPLHCPTAVLEKHYEGHVASREGEVESLALRTLNLSINLKKAKMLTSD